MIELKIIHFVILSLCHICHFVTQSYCAFNISLLPPPSKEKILIPFVISQTYRNFAAITPITKQNE